MILSVPNLNVVIGSIRLSNKNSMSIEKKETSPSAALAERSAFAWITLVMLGDRYVPGALVLGQSLQRVKTKYTTAVMVTKDVSADAKKALKTTFDRVIDVEYIMCDTAYPKTQRQKEIYTWQDKSMTKWNCLLFTEWKKIIFLDADMRFLHNADDLFDLQAPAGCFSSAWAIPYGGKDADPSRAKDGISNPYLAYYRQISKNKNASDVPHGLSIPAGVLREAFKQPTFTVLGAVVLLEPGKELFNAVCDVVAAELPYGQSHRILANGAEEAAIVQATANKGVSWRHIHQRYESIPYKPWWVEGVAEVDIVAHHYLGAHPWALEREAWPDLAPWWAEADAIVAERPELKDWFVPKPNAALSPRGRPRVDAKLAPSPKSGEKLQLSTIDGILLAKPRWNEVKVEQLVGRATRSAAHNWRVRPPKNAEPARPPAL